MQARRGEARCGKARRGAARQCRLGTAGRGQARRGKVRLGGCGKARQGWARLGMARPGVARQGWQQETSDDRQRDTDTASTTTSIPARGCGNYWCKQAYVGAMGGQSKRRGARPSDQVITDTYGILSEMRMIRRPWYRTTWLTRSKARSSGWSSRLTSVTQSNQPARRFKTGRQRRSNIV